MLYFHFIGSTGGVVHVVQVSCLLFKFGELPCLLMYV